MKAPAVVFVEPKRVEIREMELPPVGPDDVGIRTAWSGISQGTERWALTGRYGHFDVDFSAYYPCSPGYQAAGVVEELGSAVRDLQVGDHVFTMGTHFLDPAHKYPGPCQASHSGYLVASRSEVTPVRPEVDLAVASLYHMAGVSRHGVRLTKVQPGDLVVVIGLGMIGQMTAQAARRAGARVIATDLLSLRVELAGKHSADRVVDANSESLEDVLREEAKDGADVVMDTTGDSRIFSRCLGLIRREGRIAMQGYYPDPISIDFHPTHLKRPTVTFPCGWDDEFNGELADDMATGRIAIEPLITHRIPFRDAGEAYELVVEHPERSLGMVLDWAGA
ncbi:MAG TPA: zinc-binding alcohol dehydrogenase [Actinomycetota bacterium]|jgi:2-desacetyl-2-hydroxyethyl bacteriochlorophyllide A dehydrogenase|nr:zinc-binding alcohol dehydrogenase [Actinomycetota bacterium]